MRKSTISQPTLQPYDSAFTTPSTTSSKLPSTYHNVRHHYPTRAILSPSPEDPLDSSVLHFPLPPTTKTHHKTQSSIASSTTLENQGIYALSQGHSASGHGHQSRRRNLSLDSTLNEKYENAHSPPASVRSTSRLANGDSARYNNTGLAHGSHKYEDVDLERTGASSGQKSGWEKEGRRGKKNAKLMWCFAIVLVVAVVVGVVVGVVYQRRKNSVSRVTQEILADPTTTPDVVVPSATPTSTTASAASRTTSRFPTTTNSIALSIPSNIGSIASSLASLPTATPAVSSSIDFAYVIAGVTTTIPLPYTIPTNAEARGIGQVQWNSLVLLPDPANGGSIESLVRFRVPAPTPS